MQLPQERNLPATWKVPNQGNCLPSNGKKTSQSGRDNLLGITVSWKIIKKCRRYSSHTKKCNLCLHEKYIIICHPKLISLNTRNELVLTCRHTKKTRKVKVLSLPETIKKKSTFRAKALRRELVAQQLLNNL